MVVSIIDKPFLQERIDDFLNIVHDLPDEYWTKEDYLMDLPGKWKYSLCLRKKDKIIGFILSSVKNETTLHIHKFIIHKEFRGRGYGKMLLNKLHENIKDSFQSISLKVAATNYDAIRFYLSNNFLITKRTQNNYLEMKKEIV